MKTLDKEEFADRMQAVIRARKIFIPHITKSINIAFDIYQEILADRERKLTLEHERKEQYNLANQVNPLICPKCETPLMLRAVAKHETFKSCWYCNPDCNYEQYSPKTLADWVNELGLKDEDSNVNEIREMLKTSPRKCPECSENLGFKAKVKAPNGDIHPGAFTCETCGSAFYVTMPLSDFVKEVNRELLTTKAGGGQPDWTEEPNR